MFDFIISVVAFIVALSILIIVHEYGHYKVAKLCGVKVLRFSIGFGKPFFTWKVGADQTEFALAPIPFGGYVKMLNSLETDVTEEEKARAFNHQSLFSRVLIVLAGPVANLLFAIIGLALVAALGIPSVAAKFTQPVPNSMLEQAGMQAGDKVIAVAIGEEKAQEIPAFSELSVKLYYAISHSQDVTLTLERRDGNIVQAHVPISQVGIEYANEKLLRHLGFSALWIDPILLEIIPGGAAELAGLQANDVIVSINGTSIQDSKHLLAQIQSLPPLTPSQWVIGRGAQNLTLSLTPQTYKQLRVASLGAESAAYQAGFREGDTIHSIEGQSIADKEQFESLLAQADAQRPVEWVLERDGAIQKVHYPKQPINITQHLTSKIGANINNNPDLVTIRYGLLKSLGYGAEKTWVISRMLLTSIGNMIVGKAKVKDNLGGPIEIAKQLGESARNGAIYYLSTLALISISLGLLNLLPLPVLDGGHLLLYLVEGIRKKPLSDIWMGYFQRIGVLLLLALMIFVTFNDVLRLKMG